MNARIKELWVKDLEENADKQGTGCLYDPEDDVYCCLGRLSNLYILETGNAAWDKMGQFVGQSVNTSYLPDEVVKWAGLQCSNPLVGQWDCTEMNDVNEFDFPRIAKEIREHL